MATVTKKFRDDFEMWAAHRIASAQWTEAEMVSLKVMLRRDLAAGPDQLRTGLSVIVASGVEMPSVIDDHEQRYQLWRDFFASEADAIRNETTV